MEVLNPQGPVGAAEVRLIGLVLGTMLLIVIPVIVMTIAFAWRYRASNKNAVYKPNWAYSVKIDIAMWTVPLLMIVFLGVVSWRSTHALDPYRPLPGMPKGLRVEVVALDWKWLFIYPDQRIASVNRLVIPTGTQIDFAITSDTVMNVFFVPQLGTQIYAMAGMVTRLHLLASHPGIFRGLSANFSGAGFPDMRFATVAVDTGRFDAWVKRTKANHAALDEAAYKKLAVPSAPNPVAAFGTVDPTLFDRIVAGDSGNPPPPPPRDAKE